MTPARWPRDDAGAERMLVIDPLREAHREAIVRDLPEALRAGDVLVVNDAATLPASLRGATRAGEPIEARLVGQREGGAWTALLFGAGDWRTRTEDRPPPPRVAPGDVLVFDGLACRVASVDGTRRVALLRFDRDGAAFWAALYRAGRPVQYAYIERDLALWHVQTSYAARPWAAEMPSAGRPLGWSLLLRLARGGVRLAHLTHAAGLSSSGDAAVDARLPMTERYDIPQSTIGAIHAAKREGGRVIAVGTTVVRALEGAARTGAELATAADAGAVDPGRSSPRAEHAGIAPGRSSPRAEHAGIAPGEGETSLLIAPGFRPRVVDGIFTGMHDETASHFALLQAFAPLHVLGAAYAWAEDAGFLAHEFGDSTLILPGALEGSLGARAA